MGTGKQNDKIEMSSAPSPGPQKSCKRSVVPPFLSPPLCDAKRFSRESSADKVPDAAVPWCRAVSQAAEGMHCAGPELFLRA